MTNKHTCRPGRKGATERLLTVDELAAMLSVKKATIYRWTHLKLIPHYKTFGSLRFRESEVLQWLEPRRVKPRRRPRISL